MINSLISNKEKYFWSIRAGKVILGTRDKLGSAIIEFQVDEKEAIMAPVFYPERPNNPTKLYYYKNPSREYTEIKELYKQIDLYLEKQSNSDLQNDKREELSLNATNFIKHHF